VLEASGSGGIPDCSGCQPYNPGIGAMDVVANLPESFGGGDIRLVVTRTKDER
jgi:hypothetical protein